MTVPFRPAAAPAANLPLLPVHALLRNSAVAAELRRHIGDEAALAVAVAPALPDLDHLSPPAAGLFIVELDPGAAADLAWLGKLIARPGGAAIAVTCPPPSLDQMRRLMRMGVRDVLTQPLAADELRALCRAVHGGPAAATVGRVVAFLKACGGAGATSLAIQTACAAAGRRQGGRVLLIDLDLQFGSAALHLDLPQNASVVDLLAAGSRVDGGMLRAAAARHASGVEVLPAPALLTPLEAVEPAAVLRLIEAARGEYPVVLMELPQAWTAWTRAALSVCDGVVLVLELSVASVRHARRQLDTLAEENLEQIPLTLVANRLPSGGWFGAAPAVAVAEAEQVLGRRLAAALPADEALARAAALGQAVGQVAGGRRMAKRFRRLADGLGLGDAAGGRQQARRRGGGA